MTGAPDADVPADIAALLRERCARYADRTAYLAFGTRRSYRQLLRDAETFAAWLQTQGINPGDRVGLLLPNSLAFPVVAFGTLLAGAVLAPLNPLYTAREIANAIGRLRPALIVANPLLGRLLSEDLPCPVVAASLGDGHGWKRSIIGRLAREPAAPAAWTPLATILRRRGIPAAVDHAPGDLAMLQATGGSTGTPKYARLTQGNLLSALSQLLDWAEPWLPPPARRTGLVVLAALPLYHSYGFVTCCLQAASVGGCTILIADARRLGSIAAAWRRYPVELFPGVDTLFRGLLADAGFVRTLARRRGGKPILATAGGMPLTEATATAWQRAAGYPILQGYGSTETTGVVSCTTPGTDYDGYVGRPLAATQVRVCAANGAIGAPGAIGELHLRGGQISAAYWDDVETDAHGTDGWFRTGDLAELHADGRLRIVGRLKEMMIVSGFNVYPAEIEAFIVQHEGVAECAAVGVPDERAGEAVVLFVVLRPGTMIGDVKSFARGGLAAYKCPRRYVAVDALPKTPVGKIIKTDLAALATVPGEAQATGTVTT